MNIEYLQPLYDRVLVKRLDEQPGLITSLHPQKSEKMGVIKAVGPTAPLTIGDTVFFGKYAGTRIDDDYVILKYEEVLAVV